MLGLAVGIILLTAIFAYTRESHAKNALALTDSSSSSLLESTNHAKVDEAINEKILKVKGKEEADASDVSDAVPPADSSSSASYDPAKEFLEIRALAPMVVFSKTYCPYSKKLKKLLKDSYDIVPPPTIVELDKSTHGRELQEYLATMTGRRTVPNVIVGRKTPQSRGGADDFMEMHKNGELESLLNTWGEKELQVTKKETPSNI